MKRNREASSNAAASGMSVIEVSNQPSSSSSTIQRSTNSGFPISSVPFSVSSRAIVGGASGTDVPLNQLFLNNTFNATLLSNPNRVIRLRTLRAILSAPHFSSQQLDQIVDRLVQYVFTESDKELKGIAIFILGNSSILPSSSAPCLRIVDSLLKLYSDTSSKKLRTAIMQSLKSISNTRNPFIASVRSDLRAKLMDLAQLHLLTFHPGTRRSSLEVLSSCSTLESNHLSWLFETLSRFFDDPDPRVRTSSFQGILTLHQRGARMDASKPEQVGSLYRSAVAALEDDYDEVRMAAVRTVWVVSSLHPNATLPSTGMSEPRRLIDDAFAKISTSVMDGCVRVRTIACRLLGSMRSVSLLYLLQTLSKEELSRGQARLLIAHSKANEANASAGIQEAEGDISVLMYETLNDLGAGTPGCFINALEDEYMEVRMAAVDSLCELAVRIISPLDQQPVTQGPSSSSNLSFRLSPTLFSRHAMDFLVDMFNDEIEAVRVNAIHSVRKIGVGLGLKGRATQSPLREEQLHVVLGVLEDFSPEVRAAVHRLLASIRLANITCLHATVQALLGNLVRYPSDQASLFVALRELGLNHPNFTEFLVTKLLHIDPRFIQIEPSCEDLAYVATMIVVLNSALTNSTILSLLPSYSAHHYRYLKDKYPEAFPNILQDRINDALGSPDVQDRGSAAELRDAEEIGRFIESALTQLNDLPRLLERGGFGFVEAERLVAMVCSAMSRVMVLEKASTTKGSLDSHAKFYSLHLAALQQLIRVAKIRASSSSVIVSRPKRAARTIQSEGSLLSEVSRHLLHGSYQMQHLHLGLSEVIHRVLMVWRLFAHLVAIYSGVRDGTFPGQSPASTARLAQRIAVVRRTFPDLPPDLESLLLDMETRSIASLPVIDVLLSRTMIYLAANPMVIPSRHRIRRMHAVISSPAANTPERPEEFPSSLGLVRIPISATVHDIHDPSTLSVIIELPNGERIPYRLSPTDLTRVRPLQYTVKATLHLSLDASLGDAALKNKPISIAISLVNSFRSDVPELDHASANSPAPDSPRRRIRGVYFSSPEAASGSARDTGLVKIGKSNKYHLLGTKGR